MIESGKSLKVVVKDARKRSLSQNSLMWMWYAELSYQIKQRTGETYSKEDLHEYFKARFCPSKELKFGKRVITASSTTRLDTGEMTRYLDQIHEWSCGSGMTLTIPVDCEYRELTELQDR
jgi:hypothetical protein